MTVFDLFTHQPSAHSTHSTDCTRNVMRWTALTGAIIVASNLTACSMLKKSPAVVNQPAELVKLTTSQSVLSPVFTQTLGGKLSNTAPSFSVKNLNPFGKRQAQTLTQSPDTFRVAVDSQGYVTASNEGSVLATNLRGEKVWETKFKQGLASGVAVDDASDTVVVSDTNGKLIALDRNNGQQRWQAQLNTTVLSPVLISNNRVISVGNNGVISANALQSGESVWQFTTQNPTLSVRGSSSPILLDANTLLVATADGRVHALNVDNGLPLWSRRMSNAQGGSEIDRLADIDATPVLKDHMLYVVSYSGQLIAADMGSRQLSFVKPYASIKSVGVDASQLYVTTLDGQVAALDKFTGNTNWESNDLSYRGLSNAVAVGDYVLVGDTLGYLHVFNKTNGQLIDRVSTRQGITALRLAGNQVIAQSSNGSFSVWQVAR